MHTKLFLFFDLVELAERSRVGIETYDILEFLALALFEQDELLNSASHFENVRKKDLLQIL
jgi:hypothetical protein